MTVPGVDKITKRGKLGRAAEGAPESHDSRQTKTGVGSSALHTQPPCRICFPQCANCAVPQTWRKGILGKNTKSIFPAGVYAVPAERQEPGGSGPGGRDTAHGARALRSESFLYFCCFMWRIERSLRVIFLYIKIPKLFKLVRESKFKWKRLFN